MKKRFANFLRRWADKLCPPTPVFIPWGKYTPIRLSFRDDISEREVFEMEERLFHRGIVGRDDYFTSKAEDVCIEEAKARIRENVLKAIQEGDLIEYFVTKEPPFVIGDLYVLQKERETK